MERYKNSTLFYRLKEFFFGKPKDYSDKNIFHRMTLVALFAWIGLGADGLSSSCYGPAEAFIALGQYHYLGLFVALGTALTIIVISSSYSQTIDLFPTGGGGYIVASKLHSPIVGMISGSALVVDYILTISVSLAAGSDAIFSFFPVSYQSIKIFFTLFCVIFMIMINLRGVKESIYILAPIFILFLITHLFIISYSLIFHFSDLDNVTTNLHSNITGAVSDLGMTGVIFLVLKAFSMGAGTFTGIEAVSNGLPILREPKNVTGKKTMRLMAFSLSFTAVGLMLAFLLYHVTPEIGRPLNAVLFSKVVGSWGITGNAISFLTIFSEAAILFVAAQAGFIDGPRIMANMANDRWLPAKFSLLSDRLVTKYGILFFGILACFIVIITDGKIEILIVLYSINVFVTFILTESGMVKHWWIVRRTNIKWLRKLLVNLTALLLDTFILITLIIMKFNHGGWITFIITGMIVFIAIMIKSHYNKIGKNINELNSKIKVLEDKIPRQRKAKGESIHKGDHLSTFVILTNGYNFLGLNTLLNTIETFSGKIEKFIFIQVGVIDSCVFKGSEEITTLHKHIDDECKKYKDIMVSKGYESDYYTRLGIDTLKEIEWMISELSMYYLDFVVVGGKIVFEHTSFLSNLLHNNFIFSLQKKLLESNIKLIIVPANIKHLNENYLLLK